MIISKGESRDRRIERSGYSHLSVLYSLITQSSSRQGEENGFKVRLLDIDRTDLHTQFVGGGDDRSHYFLCFLER